MWGPVVSGDIVERLREAHQTVPIPSIASLYSDAADEIERLRAAGDAMADNFRRHVTACGVNDGRESLSAWQEARRE
jgi:hypothetical protein